MCISYGELTQAGIVSRDAFRKNVSRGLFQVMRRGNNGNEALVNYDNLPVRIQEKIRTKLGDNVRDIAQQNPIKEHLVLDTTARTFFLKYTYPNGKSMSFEKQKEYTATASALNAVITVMSNKLAYRRALGGTGLSKAFWPNIINALKAYQAEWGFKLPGTQRNLQPKINEYKKHGFTSLINGNDCNNYAAAAKDEEQLDTLRTILRQPKNYNNEQSLLIYNEIAKANNWRTISVATVANYRAKWKLYITSARQGTSEHNNNLAMQVKRTGPSAPMLYYTMDGWDVELLYQKQTENKNGHNVTTYHNRLTVVIVLDAFKKYPMGYAIGERESPELIVMALKNATQHTATLYGSMYLPYQLQTDNYQMKALTPFYEALSGKLTPARVKNAKAKIIEPYFKRLNETYCKWQPNWSGHNVTASPSNQPNSEYLQTTRHSFPDQLGVIKQIESFIAKERALHHAEMVSGFEALTDTYKIPLSTQEYLLKVGVSGTKTIGHKGHGILLTLKGVKYTYDSFEPAFRHNTHIAWVIKYDTCDMSHVLAHNADGTLRFLLQQKFEQPMALADRQAGDAEQLQKIFDFNKQIEQDIIDCANSDMAVVQNMFNNNPALNDTLFKMQLTDSDGQHKDRLYDAKKQNKAMRNIEKEERKTAAAEMQTQEDKRMAYLNSKVNMDEFFN